MAGQLTFETNWVSNWDVNEDIAKNPLWRIAKNPPASPIASDNAGLNDLILSGFFP